MDEKLKPWIKLQQTPEIGAQKALRLIQLLGDPKEFVGCENEDLREIAWLPESAKMELQQQAEPYDWGRICKLMEKQQIGYVTILDEAYPALLKQIFSPPLLLFYRGNWNPNIFQKTLGVVGTRRPSPYGATITEKVIEPVIRAGFTIVSGLALGIDAASHRAALAQQAPTIAVLGTTPNQIYPPEHSHLAQEIMENGLILSENCPGTITNRWNFPARNRIISGLSLGTLVVEGGIKSGAIITARFAVEQNRELFAVPGDILREQSTGPNNLIQQGAKAVTCGKDILDEFNIMLPDEVQESFFPTLTKAEDVIYQVLLQAHCPMGFDELMFQTDRNVGELSTILLSLELKNVVKRIPGNQFLVYR